MAKAEHQNIHSFTVIFEPAPEGGYVVRVPALPGCATQGETFEEAQKMAQDAIQGYLETLQKLNEDIPIESDKTVISRISAPLPL